MSISHWKKQTRRIIAVIIKCKNTYTTRTELCCIPFLCFENFFEKQSKKNIIGDLEHLKQDKKKKDKKNNALAFKSQAESECCNQIFWLHYFDKITPFIFFYVCKKNTTQIVFISLWATVPIERNLNVCAYFHWHQKILDRMKKTTHTHLFWISLKINTLTILCACVRVYVFCWRWQWFVFWWSAQRKRKTISIWIIEARDNFHCVWIAIYQALSIKITAKWDI